MMGKNIKNIIKLIICILICHIAGFLGSIFTRMSVKTWYQNILKPGFTPPDWIFFPVWSLLFTLMGISLFLIIKNIPLTKSQKYSAIIFLIHLAINIFWSLSFFALKSPLTGFIIIIILWFFIGLIILKFYKISKLASILLLPYFLWVTFAAILNFSIMIIN